MTTNHYKAKGAVRFNVSTTEKKQVSLGVEIGKGGMVLTLEPKAARELAQTLLTYADFAEGRDP